MKGLLSTLLSGQLPQVFIFTFHQFVFIAFAQMTFRDSCRYAD